MKKSKKSVQRVSKMIRERKRLLGILELRFPKLFNLKKPKPLKIGVREEIVERLKFETPEISKIDIRLALRLYTNDMHYLKCLLSENKRFDLDGIECGKVTKEEKESAVRRIGEKKERYRLQKEKMKES